MDSNIETTNVKRCSGRYPWGMNMPVKVVYNDPETIVFWSDGEKTVAVCDADDEYDKTVGLFMAICKRYNNAGQDFEDFINVVCEELTIINDELKVGDHFEVPLDNQIISVTVQRVTDSEVICMSDDCVMRATMNEINTNFGGYEASELKKRIENDLLAQFPNELRDKITYIAPPTYGQIFGHDTIYIKSVEPDNDEQFELMKKRKNRVADYEEDCSWYWLQNVAKPKYGSSDFAHVDARGYANLCEARYNIGVRVVFNIKK